MGPIVRYYKKHFLQRCDENGYIKYFTAADFPGLEAEPFTFQSGVNRLKGYFYSRPGCRDDELVVFCHGLWGGHRSYMAEIDTLCGLGYRVFAYDATGCFESEGESIMGLTQALADLNAALDALRAGGYREKYPKLSVIGHSWGGYAAGNVVNFRTDVNKAVVISGFVSVHKALLDFLHAGKNPFKLFAVSRIMKYERTLHPRYADVSMLTAVDSARVPFLISHSADDPTISYQANTVYIRENTTNRGVTYQLYEGRRHNPNYHPDAVAYMDVVFRKFNAGHYDTLEEKQTALKNVDWHRMTAQDEVFWSLIDSFLQEEVITNYDDYGI